MKIRIAVYLLLLLSLTSGNISAQILKPTQDEKLIAERFEYIRLLKNYIGDMYWKKFSNTEFPGTIVYFTDSASYFINPLPEMKDKVSKYTILENEYEWNMWKLSMPLDSATFVMETQFQFSPKSKDYINYKTPVLFCSSPELTKMKKPELNNTQKWAVALMHELYHQYQYSNEAILTYVLRLSDEKNLVDMDSLQTFYLTNQAFRDTLKLENEILKKAIAASSFEEEKKLFTEFLRMRAKRDLDFFKKTKFYINTPENFWEKLEGTCMMMEKQLKENISQIKPTDYLVNNDLTYDSNFAFSGKELSDSGLYTELNDDRFYVGTTGYNLVQLLEKNKVQYKDNFFNYASLPLELQLKYFYKIK